MSAARVASSWGYVILQRLTVLSRRWVIEHYTWPDSYYSQIVCSDFRDLSRPSQFRIWWWAWRYLMFAMHPEMFVFVLDKELLGKERLYTSEGHLWFGRHASSHMTHTSLLFHLSFLLVYLLYTHWSLSLQAINWSDSGEPIVFSSVGFPNHTISCPSCNYEKTPQKTPKKKETVPHRAFDASIGPHLCRPTSQTVINENRVFSHNGVCTDPVDLDIAAGEAWTSRIQPCSLECREVLHSLTASHARWSNPWPACSQTWPDTLTSFEILRYFTSKAATKSCCRGDLQDHGPTVCSR